jgi:hypothetical protein
MSHLSGRKEIHGIPGQERSPTFPDPYYPRMLIASPEFRAGTPKTGSFAGRLRAEVDAVTKKRYPVFSPCQPYPQGRNNRRSVIRVWRKTMESLGTMISWMVESITNLSTSLFDPKYGGVLFVLFVLVVLYSIISSINRLKRKIESFSSELSAIRSILRKIERSLDRPEGDRSPVAKEDKAIRDLLFRLDNDPPGKNR